MCVCKCDLNRSGTMLVLLLAALALFSSHGVSCDDGGAEVQWQILTKSNYSQIRQHPRLLLLVTVPWSGESRSLMKALVHKVANDDMRFGTLKLMILYRNVERILADALGAAEGTTVFYYHNNFSYKYHGKLRVQNILASVDYVMSLAPDELPLISLSTPEGLRDFLNSTDKAILLYENCGWTPRLLALKKSTTESDLEKVILEQTTTERTMELSLQKRKITGRWMGMEDDLINCNNGHEFSGVCWPNQFTAVNNSLVMKTENSTVHAGESCSLHELQQFEVFFEKLIPACREFFLPPERFRFAVVHDRSLLPLLNIQDPSSWLVTVYFSGCPSCSQVFKNVDKLRTILQSQPSSVTELEDYPYGAEATLPSKRPSILLFVDRSSDSMEIRRGSQEALDAVRQLAKLAEMSNQIQVQATTAPDKTIKNNLASLRLKHPRLQPFSSSEKIVLNDKMSIMIFNEGQQITLENLAPDLQGRSVHEILSYALKQKKELKLSSLAKDAGFQLLSKDFDVKVVESLPSHSEVQPNQVLGEAPAEDSHEGSDINREQIPTVSSSRWHEVPPNPSDADYIKLDAKQESLDKNSLSSVESQHGDHSISITTDDAQDCKVGETGNSGKDENELRNEVPPNPSDAEYIMLDAQHESLDKNSLSSVESQHGDHSISITTNNAQDWNVGETGHSGKDENELRKNFTGSFFFLDGQFRLLKTLTGGSKIPSVVIVDPISQEHYVLDGSTFSYSSLSMFVNDFLAGKLHPYLQSASMVPSPRSAERPPFVNLDFHETDSIPLVTTHTFAELVIGNKSYPRNFGNPWERNVLVLFSNSWCGFCLRMELVVREVYRAVKGCADMKTNSSMKEKMMSGAVFKFPLIYIMDCTQNDCGFIIKPILQREVYPLLLLFPAERKNNAVSYEGDIAVSEIIKFLAAHGSDVADLIANKGSLQDQNPITQGRSTRTVHHEVVLTDLQNASPKYKIDAQLPVSSHEQPQLLAGCILSATEMLLEEYPFDESKILIVQADQSTGFRGLVINKYISWDSLEDLDQGFEFLKEAPLSVGGPVVMRGMPLVALTRKSMEGRSQEVLPNIYYVDPLATYGLLEEIRVGNHSVGDFWFFLGYSSWGWEQLFHEIAQGAWNASKGNVELLEWPWR